MLAVVSWSAEGGGVDDAHRLQKGLAVLPRFGGDVEQDDGAGVGVLQLQARRLDRFMCQQVHRAAGALYT